MIIRENTTWSGTVMLSERVQVAEGAVLTLAPGTKLVGSTHARSIEVFGALRTLPGAEPVLISNVDLSLEGTLRSAAAQNRIELDGTLLYKTAIANHNSQGGSLTIRDAGLESSSIYSWYLVVRSIKEVTK